MLRLLVILVSVFALSKLLFATGSDKKVQLKLYLLLKLAKDAVLQDDATADKRDE